MKKQMVNTESTTLWSAHQGDPGQANPMLRKSGAPLWSEQQAWSQPRGQASPSSAKGQSRVGGPIYPQILEMQKKAKKRSGAA